MAALAAGQARASDVTDFVGPTKTATSGLARQTVASVSYDLGDTAYHLPETGEPVELAGTVHYPKDIGAGHHPLIVLLHGWHETCADQAAETDRTTAQQAGDDEAYEAASRKLFSWPCAPGTDPLPSERGYDYLSRSLARKGFVVLSIRANGINASSVSGDENASARAELINKHLALWQQLDSTGKGELAGHFFDTATLEPRPADFTHHIDMGDVGIMGHSRAGAGATWHAADGHRDQWPDGVNVKAVVALAPAYNVATGKTTDYEITRIPLAVIRGTCDGQVGQEAFSFAADATSRSKSDFYQIRVHGANHNYFNTQWSPESGQVAAADDAVHPEGNPGQCTDREASPADRQLTEPQQRHVGTTYIAAFFSRYLLGDTGLDPVLRGQLHPDAHITAVDVKATVH